MELFGTSLEQDLKINTQKQMEAMILDQLKITFKPTSLNQNVISMPLDTYTIYTVNTIQSDTIIDSYDWNTEEKKLKSEIHRTMDTLLQDDNSPLFIYGSLKGLSSKDVNLNQTLDSDNPINIIKLTLAFNIHIYELMELTTPQIFVNAIVTGMSQSLEIPQVS